MKLFFGLDGEGEKLRSFTVSNDLPGATELRDAILECANGQAIDTLSIGL